MPEKQSDVARRSDPSLTYRQTHVSPFRMLERFVDEMDRMFDDFGFGRPWSGRGWTSSNAGTESIGWAPRIDVAQHDNQLVIRADLPGLNKDDVKVDVNDDGITVQGERRREHEEERGGVYHRERSYGSFYRSIPLPPGAIADQAKASFRDGVLEITMPAPPEQVSRGRRLEITESKK
jgi:HSP20 family protein